MQALGAAMISSNSPAILTSSFPSSQRGQALGIQATMTYLGLTVGPSFGGWLTTQFNWHAVFYINVPVGLLALWSALRFIPMDTPSEVTERFDLQGAGIFLFGLVALLLGLNQGHEFGWASPAILLLSAIAAILLPVFVFMENRAQFPMLDLRLFRNRSFTGAVASAILNYICVSGVLFLMPFYLIQGRMLSTAQAGLIMTSQPIVMAVIAPLSGTLSDRIGPRLPAATGMLVMTGGIFLLSTVTSISPLILIIGYLVLIGLGTGTFISPNNSSLMGSAARNRQGIAAGILATARTFGMVLGVGLTGAIFNTSMIHEAAGSENPGLFSAMHMSYLVLAVIALTGALLATFRETRQQID
jgi:EmrB/QacA subfamily drug resistance transporter